MSKTRRGVTSLDAGGWMLDASAQQAEARRQANAAKQRVETKDSLSDAENKAQTCSSP